MQRLSALSAPCRRWLRSGCLMVVWFFLWPCQIAVSVDSPRSPETESQDLQPVLVTLSINRQPAGFTSFVLQTKQNQWLLPSAALNEARLIIPPVPVTVFNGESYLPLAAFKDATSQFNFAKQSLDIHFQPQHFVTTQLSANALRPALRAQPGQGVFLNYDLSLEHSASGFGQVFFSELGAALHGGVAIANFAFFRQPQHNTSLRLDTSFTVDQPERIATWRFGDTITRPGTVLGRAVRFGGIQFATNFQTQPQMSTLPMATASGQAALASTVDIFVNNVLQGRKDLPPGPFSISTLPMMSGDGELQMVIRDIAGREQLISQRFYTSPVLLAPGLAEFSIETGALRQNFGINSNDYGDLFASGSYRRGISTTLTLDGSVQTQRNGPTGLNGGAAFILPELGVGSVAFGVSQSNAGTGTQIAAGIERRTASASFGLRSQIADSRYRQMGVDPAQMIRRLDSANVSYRLSTFGSVGLAYVKRQAADSAPGEVISASYSTPRQSWGSVIFTAIKGRGPTDSHAFSVFWIMPLGSGLNGSLLHGRSDTGPDQTVLQVQRSAPPGEGYGYRLQAGINAPQQAALLAQYAAGQARLEAAQFNGNSSARVSFSGALASMDNQWFATRRINESFAVVTVPGMSQVRVYVDNQFAARTNSKGVAFLPRLHAYLPNHVTIEQLDLAFDTQIDALRMNPVPAWRSGVAIEFPVRRITAAMLRIVTADGLPVPVGAVATLPDNAEEFPVGRDGQAYLTGLQPHNIVTLRWHDQQCSVVLPYVGVEGSVPYLGEFTCVSTTP